jgi:hypothetical protein
LRQLEIFEIFGLSVSQQIQNGSIAKLLLILLQKLTLKKSFLNGAIFKELTETSKLLSKSFSSKSK